MLLSGCNENDYTINKNVVNSKAQQVRWYGLKNPDAPVLRGVADEGKLWNQKVGIYVKFINEPSDAGMIDKIKSIASEWQIYAGIQFHFVESDRNADVRIAFDWNGNDWLTWSYTGTDAKFVRNQSEPTAVFGGLQYQDDDMFKGDVLRVFGQILGLEYEQRHQDWSYWRSETQLERYWESMFEGMHMNWEEIREYVFTPLTGENAIYPTLTYEVDELSVMAWPYYTRTQTTNLLANFELSQTDKVFIGELYPRDKESLPTIQEAWVDAGYFEWVTKENSPMIWKPGMVALKMTILGSRQKYLPNVCDGEQLNSAHRMFTLYNIDEWGSSAVVSTELKKVPKFNTSNIVDFSHMFELNWRLTSIPLFDTSKGTNFKRMFSSCSSLTSIPLFNTSKGINFWGMFSGCSSLTVIPQFDTSKGVNFSEMFSNCSLLTSIPPLNTSQGINFQLIFRGCTSITTIPKLDTSNGTIFSGMFSGCTAITSIPSLNTSKGIEFYGMFSGCTAITSIPSLNTSKGAKFSGMFRECSLIITIPKLDTFNGTFFSEMFYECTSLISIPQLSTSNGTTFDKMFYNCSSLAVKPELDLSQAVFKNDIFTGTPFAGL